MSPSLRRLVLPPTKEHYIRNRFHNLQKGSSLVNLESIHGRFSLSEIRFLGHFLPNLRFLSILTTACYVNRMRSISRLTQLEELWLDPPAMLYGVEFLSVARSNHRLRKIHLQLASHSNRNFRMVDLDDTLIEKLARLLPELSEFTLTSHTSALTGASLLALGQHCPALKFCSLDVDIDWVRLVENARSGLWSNLQSLFLSRNHEPTVPPEEEVLWKLKETVPKLREC